MVIKVITAPRTHSATSSSCPLITMIFVSKSNRKWIMIPGMIFFAITAVSIAIKPNKTAFRTVKTISQPLFAVNAEATCPIPNNKDERMIVHKRENSFFKINGMIPRKYTSSATPTKKYKNKAPKKYPVDRTEKPLIATGTKIRRKGKKKASCLKDVLSNRPNPISFIFHLPVSTIIAGIINDTAIKTPCRKSVSTVPIFVIAAITPDATGKASMIRHHAADCKTEKNFFFIIQYFSLRNHYSKTDPEAIVIAPE